MNLFGSFLRKSLTLIFPKTRNMVVYLSNICMYATYNQLMFFCRSIRNPGADFILSSKVNSAYADCATGLYYNRYSDMILGGVCSTYIAPFSLEISSFPENKKLCFQVDLRCKMRLQTHPEFYVKTLLPC